MDLTHRLSQKASSSVIPVKHSACVSFLPSSAICCALDRSCDVTSNSGWFCMLRAKTSEFNVFNFLLLPLRIFTSRCKRRACVWTLCHEAFPLSCLKEQLVHDGVVQLTVIPATKDTGLLYSTPLLRPATVRGAAEATFIVNEPGRATLTLMLPLCACSGCLFRVFAEMPV